MFTRSAMDPTVTSAFVNRSAFPLLGVVVMACILPFAYHTVTLTGSVASLEMLRQSRSARIMTKASGWSQAGGVCRTPHDWQEIADPNRL